MNAHSTQPEGLDPASSLKQNVRVQHSLERLKEEKRRAEESALQAQLARSDVAAVRRSLESVKARNERIEDLKAQVNEGLYQTDCAALAQTMVGTPALQRLLGIGRFAVSELKE